jgi:hypothetical protein
MAVKNIALRPVGRVRNQPKGWMNARAVMKRLPGRYSNPNSVRNAAQRGGLFAWMKLENGRILYREADVEALRVRLEEDGKILTAAEVAP